MWLAKPPTRLRAVRPDPGIVGDDLEHETAGARFPVGGGTDVKLDKRNRHPRAVGECQSQCLPGLAVPLQRGRIATRALVQREHGLSEVVPQTWPERA